MRDIKVREFLEFLQMELADDLDKYIYLNYEKNFEEDFSVFRTDACNIVIVPNSKISELSQTQEFSLDKI